MKVAAPLAACAAALLVLVTGRPAVPVGAATEQATTPPPAPQTAQQPRLPSFRSGVELVSLAVTVTDRSGHYVTNLKQEDFGVYEDGVKQDVTFFNRTNLPIALSLLLDSSASMEDRMETAQNAAIGFAKRLRPQDLAQLVDFDSRVEVLQDFTNDPALLEAAIRKTSAGGSTALYNAVYIALKKLQTVRAEKADEIHRQAIVVLSDGEDTMSLVTFDELLDLAKRSETAIYAIGLRPKEAADVKGFKEAEFVLRQLTQQTGGRVFFPEKAEDLAGVYQQISDELSSQYLIGYTSKNARRDGSWRRVVVRAARPDLIARTKQGYYAPAR